MKNSFWIVSLAVLVAPIVSSAHHYKGLPHYSYFENYPQIPYLEFFHETPEHEVVMTVYNFQGLNLDQVDSPDDVRLYVYVYDLVDERVHRGKARFKVFSGAGVVYDSKSVRADQENVFFLQMNLKEQTDLKLQVEFLDRSQKNVQIVFPFQIKETLLQRYGVYLAILAFFIVIGVVSVLTRQKEKDDVRLAERSESPQGV